MVGSLQKGIEKLNCLQWCKSTILYAWRPLHTYNPNCLI